MNYNSTGDTKQLLLKSGVTHPSTILQQAIAEDSNHVMDWLWYSEQVESDAERRYCFERVLYINPDHREALDHISALNKKPEQRGSSARVSPSGWLSRVWMRFSF